MSQFPPRVLVACEFSGIVRDAFIRQGVWAMSCDLLPSERAGPHYQGNVLEILDWGWDLMIAHPPCTFLCNSGVQHLYTKDRSGVDPERWREMEEGAAFMKLLLEAPIPRIAVENPIMHWDAAIRVGAKYNQVIQPYQFGDAVTKATCLWLKGLPVLQPTKVVGGKHYSLHTATPGKDRWKIRSRTSMGIARAMATQWTPLIK